MSPNHTTELDGQMVDMSEAIVTVATAANEKKTGSILASIQSTITRLARGESAAPQIIAPPPLPRGRTAPLLEQCRLEWRRGMEQKELARRVNCSTKAARRHTATLQAELGEPVPFDLSRKQA
jgi:hypothetical protein